MVAPGEVVRRAGTVAWGFVGVVVALGILVWLAGRIAVVFPPLVLAGMIVFLLNPIVTGLQRVGVPRVLGTALAYLVVLGSFTVMVLLTVPAVRSQAEQLADRWPEVSSNIDRWVDDRLEDLEGTPLEIDRERLEASFRDNETSIGDQIQRVGDIGFQVFHVVLIFILGPIFAFYLLVDLPHLRQVAEGLVPAAARRDVTLLARRINLALGGFFRGQLAVAFIVGVMSSFGLWLIDLPFWLIVGMIAGFFNLVPLIGPYVGGIPAVVIALTTRDPSTALWAVLVLLVVQQIDNHFVSPIVMQRAVKLHPVVVMVALLLGGTLFGFFGLLVAVPATAVLKIVVGHVWRVHVLGQTPEEWYEESERTDEVPAVREDGRRRRRIGWGARRG